MSLTEDNISTRLLTDLSVVTSHLVIDRQTRTSIGFIQEQQFVESKLSFGTLAEIYKATPGLAADKLKRTLNVVWQVLKNSGAKGLVFAYDEAQNLQDHASKDQFPLSLLLDLFQSLQKQNIPFLLLLAGLPTLLPKLVGARTFSERMFHVLTLDRLSNEDCRAAILKPIQDDKCPVVFNEASVETITKISGGYPYFVQFICREVYDVFIQQHVDGSRVSVPVNEIVRKLDTDFFLGRWAKATDRQRELLELISTLASSDTEFTVQEIVAASTSSGARKLTGSSVNQMLASLIDSGLVFKNRHGKYSFAVPLLGSFIKRQSSHSSL
jgi:type II secretory pathway predicted ATPase ExeA